MGRLSIRHLSRDLAFKTLFAFYERGSEDYKKIFEYNSNEFFKDISDTSFALEIVEKVIENEEKNSKWISEFATSFDIDKTNPVDICIIKMVISEVFYIKNPTPVPVAVNEALLLAGEYGKDGSGSFINGVIAKIIKKYGKNA